MLTIKRVEISEVGAFGVALWQGAAFCVTLERTYPIGKLSAFAPKVPPGVYTCRRNRYNAGGYDTWRIEGGMITPDREIKIHKGNWPENSSGCVLVGEQFDWLSGRRAILSSDKAFKELMILTADHDEFQLAVINC